MVCGGCLREMTPPAFSSVSACLHSQPCWIPSGHCRNLIFFCPVLDLEEKQCITSHRHYTQHTTEGVTILWVQSSQNWFPLPSNARTLQPFSVRGWAEGATTREAGSFLLGGLFMASKLPTKEVLVLWGAVLFHTGSEQSLLDPSFGPGESLKCAVDGGSSREEY